MKSKLQTKMDFKTLPNKFFYYIAKEYLKRSYSENIANSFFSFHIVRKNKKGNVTVELSNGGACICLHIGEKGIKHTGDYYKRRFFKTQNMVTESISKLDQIPEYFSVRFMDNIDCFQRAVSDVQQAKLIVINYWNNTHPQSKIQEPIDWIIKQV